MKKNIYLYLALTVLAAVGLSACSGGGTNDDAYSRQRSDAERRKVRYESIQGVYSGELALSDSRYAPIASQFTLYYEYENAGSNPDGTLRLEPRLRARFVAAEHVTEIDDLVITAEYDDNGNITGSSGRGNAPGGAGVAESSSLSVSGQILSSNMRITLTRRTGEWGRFTGQRTSTVGTSPSEGDLGESRARRYRVFNRLVGNYKGIVEADPGRGTPYGVEIRLSVIEASVGGALRPVLNARLVRSNYTPGVGEISLTVDYNSITDEVAMRGDNGTQSISITGTLRNKKMEAVLLDRDGRVGRLSAQAR